MAQIIGDADVGMTKPCLINALDDDPGLLVKTGTTLLYGWSLGNQEAAITYVQMFNAAALTDVTLGTTTPAAVVALPASGVSDIALTKPILFSLGLVVFSTTTATGNTAAVSDGTIVYG